MGEIETNGSLGHWKWNSWEEKAQEDALFAVMSSSTIKEAGSKEEALEVFFHKGQEIYDKLLKPILRKYLGDGTFSVFEYGVGAGRVLKAVEADGHACAGVDISPTMVKLARTFLSPKTQVCVLDELGRVPLSPSTADFAFSYVVLQHISRLSDYQRALEEIFRVLKVNGIAFLQLNCEDFTILGPDHLNRTENFESYSLHYRPGEIAPYFKHHQNEWGGVYIGMDWLKDRFLQWGISILEVRQLKPTKKPKNVVLICRKEARPRPFSLRSIRKVWTHLRRKLS